MKSGSYIVLADLRFVQSEDHMGFGAVAILQHQKSQKCGFNAG